MISPLEIQNTAFSRGVRGYKEEEVDAFLDPITDDLEALIAENEALRSQVADLQDANRKYKSSEGAVLDTLESAKALMGEISASAEKRAEILLKNAELDAELIQREARESVERLTDESVRLRQSLGTFRAKYKNLLESELARFDMLSMELFPELDEDSGDLSRTSPAILREADATAPLSAAGRRRTMTLEAAAPDKTPSGGAKK